MSALYLSEGKFQIRNPLILLLLNGFIFPLYVISDGVETTTNLINRSSLFQSLYENTLKIVILVVSLWKEDKQY